MKITHAIDETRASVRHARMNGAIVGLVPTMGFLHEGHLSLIDVAREAGATFVAVSIFVNPTQFGPSDDFTRYPRDEERDRELLERAGVDLVFLPPVEVMYPAGTATSIVVEGVAEPWEGQRRPGHFNGVATVVAKLFNIVRPDLAAFGRKDAQQCAVIEQMVRDLDIPVHLVFGQTQREDDWLAMSSRNSYLSALERAKAPALHRALRAGHEAITHGIHDVASIEKLMQRVVSEEGGVEVDYLVVVDPDTFEPPQDFAREVLLAGAVRIGRTRLIDNVRVPLA
jgi:pantoate--beta-alanine ligase